MPTRIRSALFVDFDNIYIGLKQDDPRAAEEFGRGVRHWLRWIEQRMPMPLDEEGQPTTRSILVRRCYGNPETFSNYRGWFTRSGFTVVDCPPLTGAGKNSADIVMVMDILDVLGHQTHFDEFIIMSADADFTPLVLRLRAHDRRTAAIVAGNAAAAYKASCDLVVPSDVFVHRALQVDVPRSPSLQRPERPRYLPPSAAPEPAAAAPAPSALSAAAPGGNGFAPRASAEVLDAIARRVVEAVTDAGELPGSRIPEILREFPEFTPRSNWLGFYSLRALTQELISRYPGLHLTAGDKWSVAPAPPPRASTPDGDALRDEIVRVVREVVAAADEPVVMARAAQAVIKTLGPRVTESHWAGAGQFRALLEQVPDLGLEMRSQPQPGYIFDPARHHPPTHEAHDELGDVRDELATFIRRIGGVTGAPRLTPRQYGVLFRLIAEEVEKAPYALALTSSTVRERAGQMDEHIGRIAITFVLRGISFAGYRYRRTGVDEARALAEAFRGNVLNLIRAAQVVLDGHELELLDEWLLSGTPADGAAAEPFAPSPVTTREEDAPPIEPVVHETPADRAVAPWLAPEPDAASAPKPWDRALAEAPETPSWPPAEPPRHVTEEGSNEPAIESAEFSEAAASADPGPRGDPSEEPSAASVGPAAEDGRWADSPLRRWFDEWAQTPAEDRASAGHTPAFGESAERDAAPSESSPRPPSRARLGSALPHGAPPAEVLTAAPTATEPVEQEESASAESSEPYPPTESGEVEVPPPLEQPPAATDERAAGEPEPSAAQHAPDLSWNEESAPADESASGAEWTPESARSDETASAAEWTPGSAANPAEESDDFGWVDEMTYAAPAIETAEHAESEVVATHEWAEPTDEREPEPTRSSTEEERPEEGTDAEPWSPLGPWGAGEPEPTTNQASSEAPEHASEDGGASMGEEEAPAPAANPNAWQLWPPFGH